MNSLLINSIIGFSLIALFFPGVAAFIVLRNRRPNELNWTFAVYLILIAWWAFFNMLAIISSKKELALLLDFVCLSSVMWVPSTFFHFVAIYVQKKEKLRYFIFINYLVSLCFLIILWSTSLIVKDVSPRFGLNYWTEPGPLYLWFVIFFFICTMASAINLWIFQKTCASDQIQRQTRLLFWFSVIGYAGGGCDYLLSYHILIPVITEMANYCAFFLGMGIAYIIFRYRFLEVEDVLAIHRDKLALLGLMTSSLNHEIKNPLFLLRGYAQKAKSGEIQSIDKMTEQIERIGKLTERLSDFSRSGSATAKSEEVDIAQAIDNALFFANHELKYHNIEITKEIDPNLPKIMGDGGQFEQIFLNLIMNAFHAMSPPAPAPLRNENLSPIKALGLDSFPINQLIPSMKMSPDSARIRDDSSSSRLGSRAMKDGGTLTICAKSALRTPQSAIEISIIDSGHGIPKDRLKHVFEPFYTTKQGRGTGLGLHIVKTLVEQNGGKISVESEVGEGTKFKLEFSSK